MSVKETPGPFEVTIYRTTPTAERPNGFGEIIIRLADGTPIVSIDNFYESDGHPATIYTHLGNDEPTLLHYTPGFEITDADEEMLADNGHGGSI